MNFLAFIACKGTDYFWDIGKILSAFCHFAPLPLLHGLALTVLRHVEEGALVGLFLLVIVQA